jgi:hypothetical protein
MLGHSKAAKRLFRNGIYRRIKRRTPSVSSATGSHSQTEFAR